MEDIIDIPWLKNSNEFEEMPSLGRVGDYIYRIFEHEYTVTDTKTQKVIGKKKNTSFERYKILSVTSRVVIISESGRKSDGTYGYRSYDRNTGFCLDDRIPPSNKCRRRIKRF